MNVDINIKIAIFLPSLNGGGAERAMLNLAHGFASFGCAVDLVLAQAQGPYLSEVYNSVQIVDLKASRAITSLPALIRYLRREQPEILISALDYTNIIAIWAQRLSRVPCRVLVNEQNTISRSAHNSARLRQRMVPYLAKQFYPLANIVVGNSKGVADDLSQVTGLSPEEIKILYNPVVTPELREKARASVDHPWFGADQPPVILSVGRLTKQKDFPTLIRAFALVHRNRSARLIILGEGPDRPELESLVKQLGLKDDIALPGFVTNPYAYMNQGSLYILSSQWEGLPTVLIEALYCGLPIIATDCPSGPREILSDGKYGKLVSVGDVTALAQAIEDGLDGKTPRSTEESWYPYSSEVVVDQYMKLLFHDRVGEQRNAG
jgi:glycosyltransferase involved in cell wall biosynthesis